MDDWKKLERVRGSAVPVHDAVTEQEQYRTWLHNVEGQVPSWGKAWPLVGKEQIRAWYDQGIHFLDAARRIRHTFRVTYSPFDAPLI